MNQMYNKFIIVLAVILLFGGVYVYFSNDLKAQAAIPQSSSIQSTSQTTSTSIVNNSNDQILKDTAFLNSLMSLTKLKIDTSIFDTQAFLFLKDNTVVLEPGIPGRPNPFAPVETNQKIVIDNPISPVTTNEPTQITAKSVLLSGTIDNSIGVIITYFEYAQTQNLEKSTITQPVTQSLIGTFITSIKNLKSNSPYFFRAIAKINGAIHYGEIISFTTN